MYQRPRRAVPMLDQGPVARTDRPGVIDRGSGDTRERSPGPEGRAGHPPPSGAVPVLDQRNPARLGKCVADRPGVGGGCRRDAVELRGDARRRGAAHPCPRRAIPMHDHRLAGEVGTAGRRDIVRRDSGDRMQYCGAPGAGSGHAGPPCAVPMLDQSFVARSGSHRPCIATGDGGHSIEVASARGGNALPGPAVPADQVQGVLVRGSGRPRRGSGRAGDAIELIAEHRR